MQQREIRFRAWDKKRKEYVDTQLLPIAELLSDERFHHQQYTGLSDRNGKEIYEGDILKHTYGGQEYAPVEFKDGSYFTKGVLLQNNHSSVIEIIGNLYENPELLTKEKV